MDALSALGLDSSHGPLMLINAPDSVLAAAAAMKPRPSFASTLQVGEPTPRIAWWTERRLLDAATLSRLYWMVQTAAGEAWLIFDPTDEDALTVAEVRAAVDASPLEVQEETALADGEVALHVAPRAPSRAASSPDEAAR
ncbi:MAG: hypothetical protein ACRDG3_00310 [Tepidiformaceae bacterium]